MSELYSLTVAFGPINQMWAFIFTDWKRAQAAHKRLADAKTGLSKNGSEGLLAEVNDDYGQYAVFEIDSIHAFLLEDMKQSGEAAIERGLHQARNQARANSLAQADPQLRLMASTMGGQVKLS